MRRNKHVDDTPQGTKDLIECHLEAGRFLQKAENGRSNFENRSCDNVHRIEIRIDIVCNLLSVKT